MAKKNVNTDTTTTAKATPTKITLSAAQAKGLKVMDGKTGWVKISPDATDAKGWLIHWRTYPQLQKAGILDVKVQDTPKVGHAVLVKVTALGKKVMKTLP